MKTPWKFASEIVFASIVFLPSSAISVTTVGAPPNLSPSAASNTPKADQSGANPKEKAAVTNNGTTKNPGSNQTKEQKK